MGGGNAAELVGAQIQMPSAPAGPMILAEAHPVPLESRKNSVWIAEFVMGAAGAVVPVVLVIVLRAIVPVAKGHATMAVATTAVEVDLPPAPFLR